MLYNKKDVLYGSVIYALGDGIASLILNDFSLVRFFGMSIIGATLYSLEIPAFFRWLEKRTVDYDKTKKWVAKTLWATVYFNPLWIARHMLFIKILSGDWNQAGWHLISIAFWSFIFSLPISFSSNYLIQNKIKLKYRFLASSIFSGIMAVYYALSTIF